MFVNKCHNLAIPFDLFAEEGQIYRKCRHFKVKNEKSCGFSTDLNNILSMFYVCLGPTILTSKLIGISDSLKYYVDICIKRNM